MTEKLYHSIGEVARMLNVNPSVLRFWETQFPSIQPHKNKKGTRYYTDDDIAQLRQIHHLTRDCGYTLDGARDPSVPRRPQRIPVATSPFPLISIFLLLSLSIKTKVQRHNSGVASTQIGR